METGKPDAAVGAEPQAPVVAVEDASDESAVSAEEAAAFGAGATTPASGTGTPGIEKKDKPAKVEKPEPTAEELKKAEEAKAAEAEKAKAEKAKKDGEVVTETAEDRLKKLIEADKTQQTPEQIAEAAKLKADEAEKARLAQVAADAEKAKAAGAVKSPAEVKTWAEVLALPGAAEIKVPMLDGEGNRTEVSLADMEKTMPELVHTALAINRLLAGQPVKAELPAELAKMQEDFPKLQARMDDLNYWSDVMAEHPDALKVAKSKRFKEYCETNPLVKDSGILDSRDPTKAIALLDAFKEVVAKETVSKKTADAEAEKKRKANLHGDTLGNGGQPDEGSDDPDAERAAFASGAKSS